VSGDARAPLAPVAVAEPQPVATVAEPQERAAPSAGNQDVQTAARARAGSPLDEVGAGALLRICPPDDPSEREAERVADEIVPRAGRPSPGRGSVAARFGGDSGAVRIHTDDRAAAAASAVGARAFTRDADVYFGAGEFAPDTAEGAHLLAHELAHTRQQGPSDVIHREPEMEGGGGTGFVGVRPGLDARRYIDRYSANIAVKLNVFMSRLEMATGSPYVEWRAGSARGFDAAVWNFPERDVYPMLRELLQPADPETLVERGRAQLAEADPHGGEWKTGSDLWSDNVAVELKNALLLRVHDSLRRVMPRYAALLYQSWQQSGRKYDFAAFAWPDVERLVPAHPMDRLIIHALSQGGLVTVDYARMAREKVDVDLRYEAREPRTVVFEFQAPQGAWFWLRVTTPVDATREEVASALYGDPAQAWRLVDAAPLFGFSRIDLLLPAHREQLKSLSADPNTPQSPLDPGAKAAVGRGADPSHVDPLAELATGPLAEAAAMNQAAKLKPPAESTRATVLEDMRISFEVLDAMIPNAKRFHDRGELAQARDLVAAKRAALLAAEDVEVARWGAQAAEQKRILAGASAGLAEAVAQLDRMMSGDNLRHAHQLAEYVLSPLLELGEGYIRAGAVSFFVGSGAVALAEADERSRTFAVELMEGILRALQRNLAAISHSGATREAAYGVSKLREREEQLRHRLALAREQILRNPENIGDTIEKIYADVADLQAEVGIATNLDAIDSAEQVLEDSQSWASDIVFQEYAIRDNYLQLVRSWRALWRDVYDSWQKGDREGAKEKFRVLATSPRYKQMFEQVTEYADTAAKLNLVARLVMLVAITALTMGIGTWASAFAATAWGGAAAAGELTTGAVVAGFVAGTVAEATTFSVLNTLLIEPNPTWKGLLGEFGWNLALFGTLRKASMLYRGAAAVKSAAAAGRTALVAGGEMGMQWAILSVATIAREEISRRLANQKSLTKEEVGMILLQSTAMFIGMAVAMRVAEPLMKELAASGATLGVRLRLVNAQRARLAELAALTRSNGDIEAARELIVLDRAELQGEIDFYKQLLLQPAELAKAGYSPEQIASLRDTGQQQIAELGAAESLLGARRIGGNEFTALREEIPEILAAHKKAGATLTLLRSDETTQTETWLIHPKSGPEIRVTTRPPDPVEVQLATMRARLSAQGQEAFDRLVAHELTPEEALATLLKMPRGKGDFEQSVLAAARKLPVGEMVPGLYAGVSLQPQQGPWTFTTVRTEKRAPDGTLTVTLDTDVVYTTPEGTTYGPTPTSRARVKRVITLTPKAGGEYDVSVSMDYASLDNIPSALRWVNEGGVPMIPGRGTPLQTYVTLMQMREAGVQLGQVTHARMTSIVNARACCELASLRKRYAPGVAADAVPSKLIERTQSGRYGATNLAQAGVRVKGMRIEGGSEETVGEVVRGSEMDNDVELHKLGLSRKENILVLFDIIIDIEPPSLPTGTKGTTP
jgi:hypothetical protein